MKKMCLNMKQIYLILPVVGIVGMHIGTTIVRSQTPKRPAPRSVHNPHPDAIVGNVVGMPAKQPIAQVRARQLPGWRGTTVHEKEDAGDPAIQAQVVGWIERIRPIPDQRLGLMKWLDDRQDVLVEGWDVTVLQVAPIPQGWVADVRVAPIVSRLGGIRTVADFVDERYTCRNGQVTLRGVVRPEHARPGVIIND
jgi:hypothetical protein